MGWKCDDCGDHGPETGALWCPDCGSRNVPATDALGMTAADRREQFEMNCEEFGIDPATVPYNDKPARYAPPPPAHRPANDNLPPRPDLDNSLPF